MFIIIYVNIRGCPLFFSFLQQRRTPAQRSCWGSCRRRGPVRCVWTNSCLSSSSPVVIWWCVAIAQPACVTAPSAELSSGAVFALSCPKAKVWSHCYTGVACVAWSSSLELVENKDCCRLIIKHTDNVLNILSSFICSLLLFLQSRVHFTKSRCDNKIIKRAHSFINKHLFTWSHSTVLDK